MIVAGKCPPATDELRAAAERGFTAVELHLVTEDLDEFEETVAVCRSAPVDIVSVHTPHIDLENVAYIQQANDLCAELGATLVVHSTKIPLTNLDRVADVTEITVPCGYENSTGHSVHFLENVLFDQNRSLVLDTAHLYTAEAEYLSALTHLLREFGDQIPVIHCCDGTKYEDGLAFGTGTMRMERVISTIHDSYDGIVVLEVMPDEQTDALKLFRDVTHTD
ncbi:sugar phosphate isomerase/epimerase family protein [Haladaptatus caseinilyticus]|uniref:sugar phosphate isomerase/epimerase family protein n=1 Tax=Haladaptatus caseinilyticus TaxID=2993314 RepID=UPI00224A889E|nr:TIM barrel protein [Haladaptatus caseinilyticus]